ncbi:MAG: hypothetical protein Q8P21_02605 [bacterium]|nr:hypothetical protein [bacterium]
MSKTRQFIRRFVPRRVLVFIRETFYPEKIYLIEDKVDSLFKTYYRNLIAPDLDQKTTFRNAEFKVYSKHGGDGILAYIFSKVGVTNRTFVEMGVENGRECNTANLALNFGWKGAMIDANEEWIKSAKEFFKEKLGSRSDNIKTVARFITAENVNQLLVDNDCKGEIDVLSIDIDGNDYWVWRAIDVISPRVVVLEYNSAFGQHSLTIKYYPENNCKPEKEYPLYFGASLVALSKLAKQKGYILVACDCHGHDAFFVRSDVAKGKFVELPSSEAFYPNPHSLRKFGSIEKQFEQMKNFEFEEI